MRSSAQRRQLFMFLGVLLVAGGIGINILLPKILGTSTTAPSPAIGVTTTPVVISSVPLVAGDAFSDANVILAAYPTTLVPAKAYTSVSQLKDKFATIPLGPGVPITPEMIVSSKAAVGSLNFTPLPIPAGSVPYALDYDPKTMAYFLAGDRLDIVASPPSGSAFFAVTNVEIIHMGNPNEQGAGTTPTEVILVVTRAQALQIADISKGIWNGAPGYTLDRWVLSGSAPTP